MIRAEWTLHTLEFLFTAITSRDRLRLKPTYIIKVWDDADPSTAGYGEAALFPGLSPEDRPDYEQVLTDCCRKITDYADSPEALSELAPYPSIRFGLEAAILDLSGSGKRQLFDTAWTRGESPIRINGLIWMGDKATMRSRIDEKISAGFNCIKIKIGGIDFTSELELLSYIREISSDIELRLDANGAFSPREALSKLETLSRFGIHSIEQPIRRGQWKEMSGICRNSPIPIVLDEELIGMYRQEDRERMLDMVSPDYIILKPTLTGGMRSSDEWISLAQERGIGWWATSALESNIGLNAIAQWVSTYAPSLPQGLGTGKLYANNIESPLTLDGECLTYNPKKGWGLGI